MTKQLYGWYSAEAYKKMGEITIFTYRSLDDTKNIRCTQVLESATDPGGYKWPDAVCLGPVGECIKPSISMFNYKRLFPSETLEKEDVTDSDRAWTVRVALFRDY
jgi:hypothetical protein